MPLRLVAVSLAGAGLFALPFTGFQGGGYLPLLGVATASVLVLGIVETATRRLDSRRLALLAALAAIDAGLRLSLVSGIAGFSPVFFLILCSGYVFGPSFGFLTGATALLASAVATGGLGPWLPYEMFASGWVGAAAGLVRPRQARVPGWRDLLVLSLVGVVTGYAYGVATDVWDWSAFYRGAPDLGWTPGIAPTVAAARFLRFYAVTSLAWDTFRAVGNVIMIAALGLPILAALSRFRDRFTVTYMPAGEVTPETGWRTLPSP
ncbi:MAG: energy-coupling factor transport system substrate-specific component [Chloroflexota bacterium]|jgi:energy-coupling factor transport system substrate-specific component|nr:energy-coupling factor transport system substrate-specific component [Chloroflexota bacterium]